MVARAIYHAFGRLLFLLTVIVSIGAPLVRAAEPTPKKDAAAGEAPAAAPAAGEKPAAAASAPMADPPHAALLREAKSIPGVVQLYLKGNNLLAELGGEDYGQEYLLIISISKGIGQGRILAGMSWGFGDDWLWEFRKIDDKVHIIRKNVRFRAGKDSPEESAVRAAYTDSVLFSLPIVTKGPKGGDLVDLTPVFMSDLPQISSMLPGFQFAQNKSTFEYVKGFAKNAEIRVSATYASSGAANLDTVPDSRGATIGVHYSLLKLVPTGYQPRLADDRVGYFLTATKDFSRREDNDRFVRYINRWNLEKADPSAKISPPKKPIIFWVEKTVPFQYRKPIADGIGEWNKAFEKAGFVNAIEVRQQPDDASWDPEDSTYNVFRWITSGAGFAMGPSRVNPRTGQILDADIIFDADFIQSWKHEYETFTPKGIEALTGGPLDPAAYENTAAATLLGMRSSGRVCELSGQMSSQLALGAIALGGGDVQAAPELQEKLIMQGLKEVVMHEVGHTLGLRHNFKASKMLSLKDINDPNKTRETGLVASVMDYNPANISAKGQPQGDFYTQVLGPYDYWAIQYGYSPFAGGTQGEAAELKKIASRSGEPSLAYSTDEETRAIDPDPDTNRFDLGSDAIEFAALRAKLVEELVPGIVERMTKEGDGYEQARRAFNILLGQRGQSAYFVSRYIGGVSTSRSHKGDKDAKAPYTVIDATKQRESLKFVAEQVFSDKSFNFPPQLYNQLAASKWSHWGQEPPLRGDFPVHTLVLMWQQRILDVLLSSVTLERLHDTELKTPPEQDAFTTAELLDTLTKAVFSEIDNFKEGDYTDRKPAISSLRRNLQRTYLKELGQLAMGQAPAPQDCQTVAYSQLNRVRGVIEALLKKNVKLDNYTRAHLEESQARIQKILDARFPAVGP